MPLIFFCIGSFLNVVIYRLPLGKSVVTPASYCPKCGVNLLARDLIPVLSYLLLGGRCRNCQEVVPKRYPIIELLAATTLSAVWYLAHIPLNLAYTALTTILIAASLIDLDHFYIPDKLLITGGVLWAGLRIFLPFIPVKDALIGATLGFALMLVIYLVSRGGMGFGDVKLTALIGLYLGPAAVILTLLVSFVVGAVAGISLMALKIKGRKDMLPFGPFLAIGAYISMLWGGELIRWYTALIGL